MSGQLGTAAALVLAVVFAWAGVAKLSRPTATARSFAALRVPAPGAAARVVPAAEVVLAVALVVAPAPAAWAGLALLAGFTVVLARAVRAGLDVGCACFGSAAAEPVSAVELLRNAGLAALAVVATGAGPGWPGLAALVLVTTVAGLVRVLLEAVATWRLATGEAPVGRP